MFLLLFISWLFFFLLFQYFLLCFSVLPTSDSCNVIIELFFDLQSKTISLKTYCYPYMTGVWHFNSSKHWLQCVLIEDQRCLRYSNQSTSKWCYCEIHHSRNHIHHVLLDILCIFLGVKYSDFYLEKLPVLHNVQRD